MPQEYIKTEVAHLLAQESNQELLEVVKQILMQSEPSTLLKAKLTSRALKAETDIQKGLLLTPKAAMARLTA